MTSNWKDGIIQQSMPSSYTICDQNLSYQFVPFKVDLSIVHSMAANTHGFVVERMNIELYGGIGLGPFSPPSSSSSSFFSSSFLGRGSGLAFLLTGKQEKTTRVVNLQVTPPPVLPGPSWQLLSQITAEYVETWY